MTADELPVRAIVAALDAGTPLEVVAARHGMTPIGLVCTCMAWLAVHRDEIDNAEHTAVCATVAAALAGGAQ